MSSTVIVITCENLNRSQAIRKELELSQVKGKLSADIHLLVIDDPKYGIGSGSCTLNALLVVTEYLSAKAGYNVVETEVLKNMKIFIFHMGRYFCMASAGLVTLPCIQMDQSHMLTSNLDSLIATVSDILAINSPPGVWICSTDMLLGVPSDTVIDWTDAKGIRILSIPSDIEEAKNHGVLQIGKNNEIENIFYMASPQEMERCKFEDGSVPIVAMLVYICEETAQKFVSILAFSSMDSCTYLGLDQGAQACKLTFLWDVLLPMAKNVSEQDYVYGNRSMTYGRKHLRDGSLTESYHNLNKDVTQNSIPFMKQIRAILWRELHDIPLKTTVLRGTCFSYLTASGENYRKQMLHCPLPKVNNTLPFHYTNTVHSYIQSNCKVNDSCVLINSLVENEVEIEKDCVISHSHLSNTMLVRQGCIINGILPDDMTNYKSPYEMSRDILLLGFNLLTHEDLSNTDRSQRNRILVVFGVHDSLMLPISDPHSTFCNKPWSEFVSRTGVRPSELWPPDAPEPEKSLYNAKIFPYASCPQHPASLRDVLWLQGSNCSPGALRSWRSSWKFSLRDILELVNAWEDFEWQRRLYFEIGKKNMREILLEGKNNCLIPFFKNCVAENFSVELLNDLDNVAYNMECAGQVARTFSCISDVLGEMAGVKTGLRSGPAGNEAWGRAYQLLEAGNIAQAVTELAYQRNKWLGRADLLIRAARHYEGAMQILVRHAVMTARQFVNFTLNPSLSPAIGTWVIAEAPARVDLSGGWTDTPPLTYEHGGAVTNIAIKIRGKKPVGTKVRKISELQLQLIICGSQGSTKILCNSLSDIQHYSQPNAPGALLKAAICCANIIDISSKKSLQEQLKEKYGGGFEVQTWSNLPVGSGLGASSILAGTLLAALLTATGFTYDNNSLIHSVLHLEQMLTTGGGWQDQVGGLMPGIKIARSKPQLPLKVESEVLQISDENMKKILDHSVLIYTGKPRLAKNLLQAVVRNWYSRKPEVIKTADWTQSNAERCAVACVEGDLVKLGECLNNYWNQKKYFAPGCEPPRVKEVIDVLRPHIHGMSLAGAGGGGFLFAITKQPSFNEKVEDLLNKLGGRRTEEVYKLELDNEGLTVRLE